MPSEVRFAEVRKLLERAGYVLARVHGSHHIFTKPGAERAIPVPHPKKDIPIGTARSIYKAAGWKID